MRFLFIALVLNIALAKGPIGPTSPGPSITTTPPPLVRRPGSQPESPPGPGVNQPPPPPMNPYNSEAVGSLGSAVQGQNMATAAMNQNPLSPQNRAAYQAAVNRTGAAYALTEKIAKSGQFDTKDYEKFKAAQAASLLQAAKNPNNNPESSDTSKTVPVTPKTNSGDFQRQLAQEKIDKQNEESFNERLKCTSQYLI